MLWEIDAKNILYWLSGSILITGFMREKKQILVINAAFSS